MATALAALDSAMQFGRRTDRRVRRDDLFLDNVGRWNPAMLEGANNHIRQEFADCPGFPGGDVDIVLIEDDNSTRRRSLPKIRQTIADNFVNPDIKKNQLELHMSVFAKEFPDSLGCHVQVVYFQDVIEFLSSYQRLDPLLWLEI